MRKALSIVLTLIISVNFAVSALAYEFPSSFWGVNTKYEEALSSRNYWNIITYGNQIISIMKNASEGYEKHANIIMAYKETGLAYAAIGDYDNALTAFTDLYTYARGCGNEFADYIKTAQNYILQYTPEIAVYTDGGSYTYYGAKNEKQNGVLFGICANGETRNKIKNESMVLTYQELGQSLLVTNTAVLKDAAASGCAVEFALNCPNEGDDIRNIYKKEAYLKEISDLFKKYSGVPVYLRFAAEFNNWSVLADADEFKEAFRYVSNYFKNRNTNVALVWSLNYASNWYVNPDDYYPGDEYVDWVGISLYAQKYFKGDKNQSEENEVIFKTGVNSDPVIMVKDIVEKYGDRKPIMLSESGCGHKLSTTGEDITDFALMRLREFYSYLPMVYPQIKLIAYFDWYVNASSEKYDYRLSSNSQLQNEYSKLIKGPRFIQGKYNNNTDYCYRRITNGAAVNSVFEVSCYAHLYGASVTGVNYYIDNQYVGTADTIPYSTFVDASEFAGNHTLKAVAAFDNGQTLISESAIYINNDSQNITVEISGDEVSFDQSPVVYKNRTMVPMRKIFEELGAVVSWDNATQTASGKKGDRTVKISVGKQTMYVNSKFVELDTVPIVLSGRTLVPVRAVAEGLGCDVDWDGNYNLVSITPKVFKWSEWDEDLPDYVNRDLYYIEERDEYRYRTREKDYFTLDYKTRGANYVDEDVSYGSWSDWQDSYISETDSVDVETRTESSPKRYHYAHYCTGNISDSDNRYKTSSKWWHDECKYHDLGWFDSPLSYSEDSTSDYAYYVDGKRYRCSNTCYRWYLIETSGGSYTQYRSRNIYRTYTYWEWEEWSRWSGWDEDEPEDYYWDDDTDIDIDERTVYRYKEK